MNPAIIVTISAAVTMAVLTPPSILLTRRIKRAPERKFTALLPSHAELFESLYESLYISCCDLNAFDGDTYHEWCSRAALCPDQAFRKAFQESFPHSRDEIRCRKNSLRLLSCIYKAGIGRVGNTGEEFVVDDSLADVFEVINEQDAVGKACSVIKPAWVCSGKVIEPGVAAVKKLK